MIKLNKNKLIVILGPTATGKTKLAVKLARDFNGEIVSADSRQVYKSMDIGTGKDLGEYKLKTPASPAGRKNLKLKIIPHHLIDVVSPKKRFSLAQYQKLAYQAIDDILKRGKTPFLAGGTGLYIQAMVDGYVLADVKPDLKLRAALNKKTLKQLQQLAKKCGIILNQSDFNNKRRLIRVIEIKTQNLKLKTPAFAKASAGGKNFPKYNYLLIGITYPKKILNKRIGERLKYRLEKEGLIDEVKRLKKQGLSWKKLDDFGLEYRFICQYLQGKLTYSEMFNKLAIAIRQFAKRQMTWFKRNQRIIWIKNSIDANELIRGFLKK